MDGGDGELRISVSVFVDLLNQTYEYAFTGVVITGEIANLKVSRGKWLHFDLKDESASVRFFGTVYQMPGPLEDGMMVTVRGTPRMHPLYGFSVSVQTIQPAGEGSIRRAAELLMAKLQAEGIFDDARKRSLPYPPVRIGLITSSQSAAYADFIKILGARWGGIEIVLIDVLVQGDSAPAQIVQAIETFNVTADPPEVLVLTRGGGSADDLAAWSHELVARAVAASRIPTLVAIGHETDISLAELAADRRASTPSNAAEILVPDKRAELTRLGSMSERLFDAVQDVIFDLHSSNMTAADELERTVRQALDHDRLQLTQTRELLEVLSPRAALRRGYAIVRNPRGIQVGAIVTIELHDRMLDAQVKAIKDIS